MTFSRRKCNALFFFQNVFCLNILNLKGAHTLMRCQRYSMHMQLCEVEQRWIINTVVKKEKKKFSGGQVLIIWATLTKSHSPSHGMQERNTHILQESLGQLERNQNQIYIYTLNKKKKSHQNEIPNNLPHGF